MRHIMPALLVLSILGLLGLNQSDAVASNGTWHHGSGNETFHNHGNHTENHGHGNHGSEQGAEHSAGHGKGAEHSAGHGKGAEHSSGHKPQKREAYVEANSAESQENHFIQLNAGPSGEKKSGNHTHHNGTHAGHGKGGKGGKRRGGKGGKGGHKKTTIAA